MRGNEFLNKMELIDPAYIEAAEAAPRRRGQGWVKRIGAIAACLALLLSLGLGTYAYAAEVKEYNDAVRFFGDNGLPTSGLTRDDIKAVYRDITTKSFTYSKTAEVIMNSLTTDQIGGFEIPQDAPTPEDVENLWNYKNYTGKYWVDENEAPKIQYKVRFSQKFNETFGYYENDKSYFEKYYGDLLIWSVFIPEFLIDGYKTVSDGVIIYGHTAYDSTDQFHTSDSWMAKIDNRGNVLWKHKFTTRLFRDPLFFENSDGSYFIISDGLHQSLYFYHCASDGTELHFNKSEIGDYHIVDAERLNNGYIVLCRSDSMHLPTKLLRIDLKGNVLEIIDYDDDTSLYYVSDMLELEGKLYLSAYVAPKPDDSKYQGELDVLGDYLFNNGLLNISDEELTPMMRDNYTAMLLVCDPDTGTPHKFYSVKGSLGGELSIGKNGKLLWDVESITTVSFYPDKSSYAFCGSSYVYRYTFDSSGALISQEKTGEVAPFYK